MHRRVLIGNMYLPSYGVMILTGVLLANIIAFFIAKKRKICVETFLVLEIFGGIGAVIGAKLWYYLETYGFYNISIERVMSGGWSFYGGFFAGLLTVVVVCAVNRFDIDEYVDNFLFLVPFVHMFWKVGCYLAGCCYGIEYEGLFAVYYPKDAVAPKGVSLFPVQLMEALLLLVLTVWFYIKGKRRQLNYPIAYYIISYGVVRFFVEFFRYHEPEAWISKARIVAIVSAAFAAAYIFFMQKIKKQRRKNDE